MTFGTPVYKMIHPRLEAHKRRENEAYLHLYVPLNIRTMEGNETAFELGQGGYW